MKKLKKELIISKEMEITSFYTQFNFHDIPDAHSPSIVCSHKGLPISKLKAGHHKVHQTKVQVNPEPLNRYKQAIKHLVDALNS